MPTWYRLTAKLASLAFSSAPVWRSVVRYRVYVSTVQFGTVCTIRYVQCGVVRHGISLHATLCWRPRVTHPTAHQPGGGGEIR